MAEPATPLNVVIDDTTETVRVDPVTGTVEHDQPDGSVVVQLDAHRAKSGDADEDEWFANLAVDMDANKLGQSAEDLIEQIGADDRSRGQKLEDIRRGLGLLGTKLEEPRSIAGDGSSVEGMSTVTNPLLLEAVLKGWANAQAELLPAAGPVKIRNDGDETASEDQLAEAYERDLNHWFTTTAAEYYPDTSHMLLWGVYFGGCGIKKVYRCPMRRRPVSESVDVKDFIVSDTTKDLRSCARITHQIPMRPSVMKRMKFIGAYRDIGLTQPTPTPNPVDSKIAQIQGMQAHPDRPEDQPYTIWETQCELDLDDFVPAASKFKGEGIPLPYLVTIDKDSRVVLALRRDWDEDDAECERKRMYVKYPYVPGPGFYGTGMLNILGNSSAAMTAAWREALDAGMFASFPGGLFAKLGGRQNTSMLRASPGQFLPIETNGQPIQQIAMGMPYRDVTAGLISMMDKITQQAKELGGVADIPSAEGIQNVPVGTMLAQIEQATKIMAAAHKGMHQAQAEELQLIVDLFRLNPEDFWRSNKVAPTGYWTEERFLQAVENVNLVPVSDPNVPSHIHRVAKALALVQLIAVPDFKPYLSAKDVLQRCLSAIREDIALIDPQPQQAPPDPKLVDAQAKVITAQSKQVEAQIKSANAGEDLQFKREELQTKRELADSDLVKERIIHQADGAKITHDMAMERQQAGLTTVKAVADEAHRAREHSLGVAEHTHSLDQAQHERRMDVAQHALDVHEVLHPPKPVAPKKPKKPKAT